MKTDKSDKHSQQNDKAAVPLPLPVERAIYTLCSDLAMAERRMIVGARDSMQEGGQMAEKNSTLPLR